MSLDHIPTQSSYGTDLTESAYGYSPYAPAAAIESAAITNALCSQLDRVLDELWSFANDQTATPVSVVAVAQLALRVSRLYPQATPTMSQSITLGERVLELHGGEAAYGREALLGHLRVQMTHQEAALLRYLIDNRDRILSREELMKAVWQKQLTGPNARTIDIHIHRLRRKLGPELAQRLETVRGVGYKLSLAETDAE